MVKQFLSRDPFECVLCGCRMVYRRAIAGLNVSGLKKNARDISLRVYAGPTQAKVCPGIGESIKTACYGIKIDHTEGNHRVVGKAERLTWHKAWTMVSTGFQFPIREPEGVKSATMSRSVTDVTGSQSETSFMRQQHLLQIVVLAGKVLLAR